MNAGPALRRRTLRDRLSIVTGPTAAGTERRPHGEPPGARTSGMHEPTG
jgi:hypothetical protein